MTTPSPSSRHPILLSLWAGLVVLSGLGLSDPAWYVLVFLASPIVAIGTFAVVYARRDLEVLRPGWSIAYRAATALLALAGFAGMIATAGRLAGADAPWFEDAPLALLFLLAFLAAWPTVASPSPRRAAIPAMVVHSSWLPLVIANAVIERGQDRPAVLGVGSEWRWAQIVGGVSLISILALSAIVAVLSVVAFSGEARIARARATPRG